MEPGKRIQYRLIEIHEPAVWIKGKEEGFIISSLGCDVKLNLGLTVSKETERLELKASVEYHDKQSNEQLLTFETVFIFHIINLENALNFEGTAVDIPDMLLGEFLSVSIGAIRGMIALTTSKSYLKNSYLPIYNIESLLQQFKGLIAQTGTNIAP